MGCCGSGVRISLPSKENMQMKGKINLILKRGVGGGTPEKVGKWIKMGCGHQLPGSMFLPGFDQTEQENFQRSLKKTFYCRLLFCRFHVRAWEL